jgi:hypothetical protein
LFDARKSCLNRFNLDVELFSVDGVAWIIQKYLNTYKDTERAPLDLLPIKFFSGVRCGEIAEFMGTRPKRRASFSDEAIQKFYHDAQYAIVQPATPSIDTEPNAQERAVMETLLRDYVRVNPKTLEDRLRYFLGTKNGRLLFYFYTRVLDSVTNRVLCVAREDHYHYIASPDGVPGDQKSYIGRATERVKKMIASLKAGNGIPPEEVLLDNTDQDEAIGQNENTTTPENPDTGSNTRPQGLEGSMMITGLNTRIYTDRNGKILKEESLDERGEVVTEKTRV